MSAGTEGRLQLLPTTILGTLGLVAELILGGLATLSLPDTAVLQAVGALGLGLVLVPRGLLTLTLSLLLAVLILQASTKLCFVLVFKRLML